MAARRVAAEAGGDAVDSDDDSADAPAGLFLPAEPKRRADWLSGAPLRNLAVDHQNSPYVVCKKRSES